MSLGFGWGLGFKKIVMGNCLNQFIYELKESDSPTSINLSLKLSCKHKVMKKHKVNQYKVEIQKPFKFLKNVRT